MGEERAVLDGIERGSSDGGDVRKDLGIDVEGADQHRPEDQQDDKRRDKSRGFKDASARPHRADA